MFPGELAFLFGQIRFPDGNHEAPVLADRAALHPGHDQVQFLELDARARQVPYGQDARSRLSPGTAGMTSSNVAPWPLPLRTRTEP